MTEHPADEARAHPGGDIPVADARLTPLTVPPALRVLGAIFLVGAIAMVVMLALKHVGGLALPGCGPGSGCAKLADSYWGKVPGTNWPVSFAGLAYFVAVLIAWLGSGRGVPVTFRYLIRLGVLASVWFTVVMIHERHFCQYCVGGHLANIAFWIVMECVRARAALSARVIVAACGAFVLASAAMGVVEWKTRQAVEHRGEQELAESTAEIISAATRPAPSVPQAVTDNGTIRTARSAAASNPAETSPAAVTRPAVVVQPPTTTSAPATGPALAESDASPEIVGFRSRYLYGPPKAAVRLVLITDYQCRDCRRIENEVRTLLERHDDVSLSIKHFPFHELCNPTVTRTLHANACWAARATEAAGILWGNDGFWAMHHWQFDHQGRFETVQDIENAVREIGYDPAGFVKVMTSSETLERVQADIEEARQLGLFQTPMIFINGVELRGWYARNAVVRAVAAVLATHPEPRTHEFDSPPLMVEKCVGDWREQRQRRLPPDQYHQPLGPDTAPVKVVVFGDHQQTTSAEADEVIRDWMTDRTDTQYVFRHYPFDQACNPHVSETKYEHGCRAARVVEAAGRLDGNAGYWRMHTWLMRHQEPPTDQVLREAAAELGFDPDALLAAMKHPDVEAAVADDVEAGDRLRLGHIPTIYVNGKSVVRWRWQGLEKGREIIRAILNAAAAEE